MKQEMQIKYVKMPITHEQKRAYNLQGFQVVDAKFAPEGEAIEEVAELEDKPLRRGRRAQADEE